MDSTAKQRNKRRRARAFRILVMSAVGYGLGFLCPHLPEWAQTLCQLAAKLVALVGGA